MVFDFSTGMLKFAMGIATFVFTLCAGGLNSFFCGLTKRIYFNGMRSSMGDESRECGYYLAMGATFTVSSLFYALYMFRYSIKAAVGTPGPVTVIIVCAIAAFELALSFGGLVRARREGDLLMEGKVSVKVLKSEDQWFGVTYKEDREAVMNAVGNLIENGVYPSSLYK